MFGRDALQNFLNGVIEFGGIAARLRFDLRGDIVQRFRHDAVHHDEGPRDALVRADGAELESVAGEGEGAGAVAVAGVTRQGRQGVYANRQRSRLFGTSRLADFQLIEHIFQLLAEKDRDNGGRRLVRAEAVVVAGGRDSGAEQGGVLMHGADGGGAEHEELRVIVRVVAGVEQVAEFAAKRPVHVLAGAVHARKRFFMQETRHAVFRRHALKGQHNHVLMIVRHVRAFIHGRNLELARRDFVVPRFNRDSLLDELVFRVHHKGENPLRNRAEVMILKLLAFGRFGAEEGAARVQQGRDGRRRNCGQSGNTPVPAPPSL